MTRILVLSDLHLVSAGLVRGVDPRRALTAVLDHAGAHDHLVVTGDLAHTGRPDAYALLRRMLGARADGALAVAGNHDRPDALRAVFPARASLDAGPWRLIALETWVHRRIHGRVGAAQLARLEHVLADGRPTLLFLHHPPVSVGTPWLDWVGLRDAEALARVVARGRVEAIFHGHAHMASEGRLAGVPVYGTPSTVFQFVPGSWLPLRGRAVGGYRVIDLGSRMQTVALTLG